MHEQLALRNDGPFPCGSTVWETVKFETERREMFVLIFFTFSTPVLLLIFYFLKPPESLITNKGSKRGWLS